MKFFLLVFVCIRFSLFSYEMEFEEKIQNEIQNLTYQILAIDNENSLTKSYLCGKFDAYNELLLFYYKTHFRKNVNGEIYGK